MVPALTVVSALPVTWQLPPGESLRVQLVRVLQTHQRLGRARFIFWLREVLSMCGHVGDEL